MSLTNGQFAVLDGLSGFNKGLDDQALSVYVHHISEQPMSSSGIRTRRSELYRKGLVSAVGLKTTRSGRSATIFAVNQAGKAELARERKARKAS